ncbi:MAG: adenosylcobinamide-GDP ribazoletransferase [Candidatus Omnitrophota bacterium]
MKQLLFAIQFLTILPVKLRALPADTVSGSLAYFPLVGLLLGAALCLVQSLGNVIGLPALSNDIVLVISLAMLTAAMHLDGLADTADGFLSGKSKEEVLNIMKDPHIGVMGVVGIISVFCLKIAFLYSIATELKPAALILMCMLSRWALVWNIFLFPYARKEGKALLFFNGITPATVLKAALIALTCALIIGGLKGFLLFFIITIAAYYLGSLFSRKIGGMTGDTLGAVNEISEIIVLLWLCIL